MKKRTSKLLSLLLTLAMVLGMLPAMSITAAAAEPLIEGTTGAGTKSDPVIVDTFAELKAALQYVGDLYIRMDEFKPSLEGLTYETLKEGTHYTNNESAIKVPANYTKHLELNADVDCRATETEKALYSFITNVGKLYITGTGSLRVSFNATAYSNAIIYNMAPGMVQIDDNVTFDATQKSIQCHGYAVINYSGTLNITGGIFKGENSGPTSSRIAAVSADMGTTNISGGTFEAAVTGSGGGTGYGLIIKDSAAVTLTGGSFKGFYLPESTTLANYYDTEKYVVTEEDGWTTITDPSVVKSVSLTLPEPTDGGNPTTPTCATDNVTIGTCEWILDSTVLSSDATFENGRTYRCGVIIYPKSGYTLDKNATVTINGRPMTVQMQTTSYINCYIDFTITAAPISSIALSVTAPVAGGTPSAPSCDMKSVTINSYEWTGLGASGTFENGNTYSCYVLINPASGYTFDENATVTINGRPMTVQLQGTDYINCYVDFTVKYYSGTGTYNDPAVCTNFEAFKQAMENSTVTNVVLKGGDVVSKTDTIPEPADGKVTDAVICSGKNGSKVLILEGKTEFVGCSTIDSLINLSVGERLTIMGDGELNYKHDNFHEAGAVVELSGQSSGLTVKGNVTLRGKTTGGVGFHGRAIYATNGTVDIHSGSFWGGGDLGSHADQVISSAVSIIGNANLNINGGSFTPTGGSPKCALYLDTTGTVNLREGTFYGKGIVIEQGGTIDATGYFTGTEIKIGSSTVAHTENVSALAGNTVQLSFAQFIHEATITVTDPMSGQAPNTTSFTVGDSTYTVDKITWYNGGTVDNPGTKMDSGDKFVAGQTYIVDVYVKPTGNYIIPVSGFTATINGVSTNEAKSRNVNTGAGSYRVALTCNKSLITSLSATGLPTLPEAGTKGEGVVNVPLTVTDPGYTATFTGWLRKTTLGDRQGYSVMTASNTFEAGETYFAEVMIVPVDGNLISTNATATVDGNTAVYTSATVDGKRSYVVPFTVPNEAETTYTIEVENCREWNGKTKAAAGTKLTFISPSTEFESAGIFAKQWLVTVGNGEPTVVPDATQFNLTYEMPAANLKVKAVYTPAVTFMDGVNTIAKKAIGEGNKVTDWPANPTKEGYVFKCWCLEDGTVVDRYSTFTGNTTVDAQWNKFLSVVEFENVGNPTKNGEDEIYTSGAKATTGIKIKSVKWEASDDGETGWTALSDGSKFLLNKHHRVIITFEVEDGYVLNDPIKGATATYSVDTVYVSESVSYDNESSVYTLVHNYGQKHNTQLRGFNYNRYLDGVQDTDPDYWDNSMVGGGYVGNTYIYPCSTNRAAEYHFDHWAVSGDGVNTSEWQEGWAKNPNLPILVQAYEDGDVSTIYINEYCVAHTAAQPATCTHKAVCSCGAEFDSLNPNNHSDIKGVYSITSATHQLFCQDCGEAMEDAEAHDFGGDNICDTCGYDCSEKTYTVTVIDGSATPASATKGTTVTLTADEPADGMKFKEWVVVSGSVTINSDNTFTMPESNVVIMASYVPKVVIPGTFAVTVNGSYASATGAGAYAPDEVVSIHAGTRSNYTFAGWTSSDVTIAGASNADASFIMPYNDVTVTANWTYNGSSGGSSGGGVSTYAITVNSAKNGDVTSSHKSAAKGTTITLTVEPDKGYTLETITATDASGNKLKLTEKDGKYTFTMPASKVTVKATFMEDNSMLNFFVDVPADAYYYDAVLWAAEEGITGGVDATHFAPNATCTRAQAVTFLWRAAGSPAPKSSEMPFTDVAAGSYYYDAVLWAVENGITKGTSDTTFTPNAKCTRAQIVTFLWRSQKSPASDSVNPFTDVAADAYYSSAVLWAVENGITAGTTATTFSPNNDCTRAQIVTFLFRCLGK